MTSRDAIIHMTWPEPFVDVIVFESNDPKADLTIPYLSAWLEVQKRLTV